MDKLERILSKIKQKQSARQIAKQEGVDRYTVSLLKRCLEKYERQITDFENTIMS